ncbi:ATP-dependent helicase, partial [Fusobacterium mortiferum]
IYRFRGATIRNILEFPNNFKNCKVLKLETNYRSDKNIIEFYDSWMKKLNWYKFRHNKSLKAFENNISGQQRVIKVSGEQTEENWYNEVLNFITYLKRENILTDYNQIAFLFKSVRNSKVIGLYKFLESHGIPVYSPRAGIFFERDEIKIMLGGILGSFPRMVKKILGDSENELNEYYKDCLLKFNEVAKQDKELSLWFRKKAIQHANEDLDYSFSTVFYELLQFEPFSSWLKDEKIEN